MFSSTLSQKYFVTPTGYSSSLGHRNTIGSVRHQPTPTESNAIVRMLCCKSEIVEEYKAYSIPANLY